MVTSVLFSDEGQYSPFIFTYGKNVFISFFSRPWASYQACSVSGYLQTTFFIRFIFFYQRVAVFILLVLIKLQSYPHITNPKQ